MGRKSREKRERRSDPMAAATLKGRRAEQRGRRVAPTVSAFEQVAQSRGTVGVVEALISRHNQRWASVGRNVDVLGDQLVETLHVLFPMDVALWRLGVRFDGHPADFSGTWPEHLRWATDSACQVQRLLLGCNAVGAAAVARTQLERWSSNRTSSNERLQDSDASTTEHYSEIWSDESPRFEGGKIWTDLSELLHGRGALVNASRWEACHLARPQGLRTHRDRAFGEIQVAVQLALRQALLCVVALVEEDPFPNGYGQALRQLPLALPSEITINQGAPMVWPLTFEALELFGPSLEHAGEPYLADVRLLANADRPRRLSYSERSIEAYASRRARAAATAREAFLAEQQQLGTAFEPLAIQQREFGYIVINESAGLLALWGAGPEFDALAVGASALRASFWLWLEDDDRALVLARSVLEQTARLRTWRLRPNRAQRLEDRKERTTPRDWLDAAGWRRLSVLNRALGEFAHASPDRVRWSAARTVLSELQAPLEHDRSERIQTVRGGTLNAVAFAFGLEVLEAAKGSHPPLARALEEVLPYDTTAPHEIENWLERCWQNRAASFGEPDFTVGGDLT